MLTEKDYCDYETCVALKELGYPKPQSIVDILGIYNEVETAYSIGELIEFLEPRIYRIENEMEWIVDGLRIYRADTELINALFEACVTLKEEGLI